MNDRWPEKLGDRVVGWMFWPFSLVQGRSWPIRLVAFPFLPILTFPTMAVLFPLLLVAIFGIAFYELGEPR